MSETRFKDAALALPTLVSLWGAGDSAKDLKGSNHGSYQGAPATGEPSLLPSGEGASMRTASGKYISIPDAASLDLGDSWAIFGFVMLDPEASEVEGFNQNILFKGLGAYGLRLWNEGPGFPGYRLQVLRPQTTALAKSSMQLMKARPYFVLGGKAGAERKLYVNGVDVTEPQSNTASTNNAQPVEIGQNDSGFTGTFEGWVQYLGVCSALPTKEQVEALVSAAEPPPPIPAAHVLNEPVDDRIFIHLGSVDGLPSRLSGEEPDASMIPTGFKSATSAPGGHVDASFSLVRDPRRDYPDLNLVDDCIAYGRVRPMGRNIFEGQASGFPSDLGETASISVKAVGSQVELVDNENFTALYAKLGFDGWGDPPLWRKQEIAGGGFTQGKIQGGVTDGGIFWDIPKESIPANEHAELWWRSPAAAAKVRKVGYRGKRTGDFSKFQEPLLQAVDSEAETKPPDRLDIPLTFDDTPRTVELSGARRQLVLRALTTLENNAAAQQVISAVAEYGDHGLALREIAGGLPGLYAHDILGHLLSTGAPELNFTIGAGGSIVPNESFVVPDFALLEATTPRAGIEKLNAYFLNNWGVWDDKEFFWQPWDPARLTWNVSVAGGAHWSPAGRQAETLLNGIVVPFTDYQGVARTAGPPGSGCDYEDASLSDLDLNNPYTRRGRRRWGRLEVSFPLAYPSTAIQLGSVFMAESKFPQRSGTLVVRPKARGHVPELRHPTLGRLPVWAMRAGDFAQLDDWPSPEPFRVISTEYDHESKTLTAQLDTGAARLSAILERAAVRLAGIV